MRRIFQNVVSLVRLTRRDRLDLASDGDKGVAETIELYLRFAFGGLDHQCAGNGPAHGRGMIVIILKTLSDILDLDAVFFEAAAVDDTFVGNEAARAFIENRIVRFESAGDVVSIKDRDFSGLGEAGGAHHANIHPRNRKHAGRAVGRGRNCMARAALNW